MSAPLTRIAPARSTFVTVLAWIFIGLSSTSVLMSIMQNVMMHLFFRGPEFEQAMQMARESQRTPDFATVIVEHIGALMAAMLVMSIAMLVASIGLLRRLAWARWMFIGLMVLGIAWNLGGFLLQLGMMSSITETASGAPEEFQQQFEVMFGVMIVFAGLFALGFSVLFGWIIRRLLSAPIAAEFTPARVA